MSGGVYGGVVLAHRGGCWWRALLLARPTFPGHGRSGRRSDSLCFRLARRCA